MSDNVRVDSEYNAAKPETQTMKAMTMNFFNTPVQTIQTTQPGDGSFTETKKAAEAAGYKVLHSNAQFLDTEDITGLPYPAGEGKVTYHNPFLNDLLEEPKTLIYFSGVNDAAPRVRDMIQHMVEQRTMPMGEKIPLETVVVATA